MSERELVTKLQAVRRQLETALRLYAEDGDAVAIHTLTAAAYDVLRHVSASRGGSPMWLKDSLVQTLKPEYQRLMIENLNRAQNFFKHADRDAETTLEFNPAQTEALLADACQQF